MSSDRTRFAPNARSLMVAALFAFILVLAGYGLWSPPRSAAATSELFFSEYIEGSSNNKALEIYNGTGAPVNLATGSYNVQMFFNGSTTAGLTINLTGTIANGDVFVLAQASADPAILAQADLTNTSGWFNGDDAVVLRKGTTIVDVIGQIGTDPGAEWGSGLTSTADNTIRRNASICAGDTNGSDAFNPATEWDGFANDTFGGLGAHTANCGLNQAISPSCPGSLSTAQGTATSAAVTAIDPDGTVTSATITSTGTTPAEPGITLTGLTPAAGVGGTAAATLNVANTTPQGTYSVVIQWQNNDSPTPQTATCTVSVSVTPPGTPTPTPTPTPVPGSVVISQVYGGGGNSGATLKNDFIEIINHSGAPINLNGWSVQYASATLSNWQVTPLTNFNLQPGQYYLIKEAAGAGGTVDLPAADATGSIGMGAGSGKVALVGNTTPLTGNCPVGGAIVDFVGYDGANCSEGSPTPATSNTTAALRKLDGCLDTDNNLSDFNIAAPNPRNSASPINNCTNIFATGSASPDSVLPGDSTTLSVQVFPGSDPPSSGINVVGDLTSIGGSATQMFNGAGNNFTFLATVPLGTSAGLKVLPITITDAQARTAHTTIALNIQSEHLVISQIYGGGGNAGAVYANDYVELYNPTNTTFNITGWSLQYGSATGISWTNRQAIGGSISPGNYYLVKLGAGTVGDGAPLPASQISGSINMSATTGKVALVNNSELLSGGCPLGSDPNIVDFVGYGPDANCREGAANAPQPSATQAIFRVNGGETDTDQNGTDFVAAAPNPRQTEPIVELGPWVAGTDPLAAGFNVPYDDTVTIDFSEPVDVTGGWYNISCTQSGLHNDATVAMYNNFMGYHITPNTSFQFGEQCTVTIFKNNVSDKDTDDSNPDTDHPFADEVFSFTVVGAGAPAPYPATVHLALGNPSNASSDPNNFLMEKPTYSLSYNRDKGTPNWVSWHLEPAWFGSLVRVDTFRADPKVSPDWYRVQSTDYFSSGFDRGHMTPNADRDNENRIPINQETYLMTNMVPQAPDNNQGPWADMENDLRGLLTSTGGPYEMYIVSGPLGIGGTGSNGPATTIANGHVTVPAFTWKVVLMIPKDNNDLSRVNPGTRTIAVMMPNIQGIFNNDWHMYVTTVDAVEQATGYDFFSNVSPSIQKCIEAGIDGNNPPCTDDGTATTAEDSSVPVTLAALNPNAANTLTYEIVDAPDHGNLTGSGANRTYQPNSDFYGTDTFTFRVSDGTQLSNISTVTITVTEVNDSPTATADSASTDEDTPLDIDASTLTTNDGAGPPNEAAQVLTVTSVSATADTHGTVTLNSGTIAYSPASNYNGPASFNYQVCDNGTTNGAADPKCTTGTVNITVNPVNDQPTLAAIGPFTVNLGDTLNFTAVGSDLDLPAQTLTYSLIDAPAGSSINSSSGAFSWTPTAPQAGHIYTFTVRVTDDGTPNLFAERQVDAAVAYTWSGLLAPITAGGTYKAGRTIPIKFQLTGPSAVVTNADIHLLLFKVNNNVIGDEVDVSSTSAADTGNRFRYSDGYYIFNLNTAGLTAGTYQLQIDMGDGVMRSVNISLK